MRSKASSTFLTTIVSALLCGPALLFAQEKSYSSEKYLDLAKYNQTMESINASTEDTAVDEFVDYIHRHPTQNLPSALSRFSESKLREWSKENILLLKSASLFLEEETSSKKEKTSVETRFKMTIDPLKEKAKLRVMGAVTAQVELTQDRQLVSVDLYKNIAHNMTVQFQRISESHDQTDRVHFQWHF